MLFCRKFFKQTSDSMLRGGRGKNTLYLILFSGTNKHHCLGSEPYHVVQMSIKSHREKRPFLSETHGYGASVRETNLFQIIFC